MSDEAADSLISGCVQITRKNWRDWRVVFEHGGPVAANPLLADLRRFVSFTHEYSVARTIRHGTRDRFRLELIKRLQDVIGDDTGRSLDTLDEELRPSFGTHDPPRRLVSVLSKVSAFVRPEQFVAWDTCARKELKVVLAEGAEFGTYEDYLASFEKAWSGRLGGLIRDWVTRNGVEDRVESEPRFQRRVQDVYLMKSGGRKI
jgi:hypothetical protein